MQPEGPAKKRDTLTEIPMNGETGVIVNSRGVVIAETELNNLIEHRNDDLNAPEEFLLKKNKIKKTFIDS